MPNVKYIAGGATQNSIRVAQWMLQAPAGTWAASATTTSPPRCASSARRTA